MNKIALKLLKVARKLLSSESEKEVERLLKFILKHTEYEGKAFSVGGYNRDELLGLDAKDLDIVVELKDGSKKITHFIHDKFKDSVSTPRQMGAGYPIWQITFKEDISFNDDTFHTKGAVIEFADTMKESFPDENSRQRVVDFGTLDDDVKRRDFTVNMMLKDLSTGEYKDLTGVSRDDIEKGILRGHPDVSLDKIFSDDPLRMIRLVRFQCKYGWKIPVSVLQTVKRNAERIKIVSAERIMGELEKVMKLGKLHTAVRLMKITNLLQYVLPEIAALEGVEQHPNHHSEGASLDNEGKVVKFGDVFTHTMLVLKNAPATLEGQMAALLHDVGKKDTQNILENNITFYGHEKVGAEIAEAILYRLKFEAKTIKNIKALVENHMRPHSLDEASEKTLRKFLREIGEELVDSLLDLAEADTKGSIPLGSINHNYVPELREKIMNIRNNNPIIKTPVLNGKEISEILKVKPSPLIGKVISFLMDLADEYAGMNKALTKEEAKKIILEKFSN